MARPLKLSIDSYAVAMTQFVSGGYERLSPEVGSLEYSLAGVALVDGQLYEPKFTWTIKALLTEDQKQQLNAIFRRSERKRRTLQGFAIRVHDSIEPIEEDSAGRSRALADGATVSGTDPISYYAQFDARMFEPRFEQSGNSLYPWIASFVMRELSKVAP